MLNTKCIVVLCLSKYYKLHLSKIYPMLEKYANKCNADLKVQDCQPDISNRHSLMCQKLLIPYIYKAYEHVLMLDLDILITDSCPDLFEDFVDSNIGFSAVENPINSTEYSYICDFLWKTTKQDFQNPYTGELHSKVKGINGGVMYFDTKLMADLLHNFYFDESTHWSKNTQIMNNEETPMFWLASQNEMFSSMDKSYNFQMFFHLAKDFKDVLLTYRGFIGKLHRKTSQRQPAFITNNIFGSRYKDSISSAIDNGHIIHFAGGFPYPYYRI